jgi:hypothetical protein
MHPAAGTARSAPPPPRPPRPPPPPPARGTLPAGVCELGSALALRPLAGPAGRPAGSRQGALGGARQLPQDPPLVRAATPRPAAGLFTAPAPPRREPVSWTGPSPLLPVLPSLPDPTLQPSPSAFSPCGSLPQPQTAACGSLGRCHAPCWQRWLPGQLPARLPPPLAWAGQLGGRASAPAAAARPQTCSRVQAPGRA